MSETPIDPAMRRRVVWSSTIGNALEWFDFIVFGLFAGVIGKLFFPKSDETAALLAAYGLLAVAYLFRPLGGIFFGVWADRVGRKRALVTIVLTMAVGTGLIGVMPTYQMIGVAAPLGLLAARLLQGFSAGGEYGASTAMLVEFAPAGQRAFYGSFQYVGQFAAIVIASLFAFVLNSGLSPQQFESWGWRVPFLTGLVIAPIGFYVRRALDETPEFRAFLARQAGAPNTPLRDVVRDRPRAMLALTLFIAGGTAFTYIMSIFLPNFAASGLSLKLTDAQLGLLVVNVAAAMLIPFAGSLSDRLGRLPVMAPAVVLFIIASFILASRLVGVPSNSTLWALQSAALIMVFAQGPSTALTMEVFPVGMRSTGASIVYNLAVAIFGGLSPYLVTRLIEATQNKFMPFYYMEGCLVLALIGLAILPKRAQGPW
jgi:MFS transporter, MHS family, proline/betaine transporter